jgi:hypothetical protein
VLDQQGPKASPASIASFGLTLIESSRKSLLSGSTHSSMVTSCGNPGAPLPLLHVDRAEHLQVVQETFSGCELGRIHSHQHLPSLTREGVTDGRRIRPASWRDGVCESFPASLKKAPELPPPRPTRVARRRPASSTSRAGLTRTEPLDFALALTRRRASSGTRRRHAATPRGRAFSPPDQGTRAQRVVFGEPDHLPAPARLGHLSKRPRLENVVGRHT